MPSIRPTPFASTAPLGAQKVSVLPAEQPTKTTKAARTTTASPLPRAALPSPFARKTFLKKNVPKMTPAASLPLTGSFTRSLGPPDPAGPCGDRALDLQKKCQQRVKEAALKNLAAAEDPKMWDVVAGDLFGGIMRGNVERALG